MMQEKQVETAIWHLQGLAVPVKIYREKRHNARCSVGKSHVIVRLPLVSAALETTFLNQLKTQAEKWFSPQSPHRRRFDPPSYPPQYLLSVGRFDYQISIIEDDVRHYKARFQKPNSITITKPKGAADSDVQAIPSLLSRVVSKHQAPYFIERVKALNAAFFKKDIQNIQFQYNFSNWGSCSSQRRLKFSSRLLFAPTDVQDYVIVHELAHLIEMNHSERFWHIVRQVMPDFETHEKWLKNNGHLCYF